MAEDTGFSEDLVGAERGWIGDPQHPVEWRDSHQSRTLQKLTEEIRAEQEAKNAELHEIDHGHIGSLRIADRYTAGRPGARRRRQLGG